MLSLICVWIDGWVKKSSGWWFETLPRQLWRHCNEDPKHRSYAFGTIMTSSNGNIFRVTGRVPVTGEFPSQRPVTRGFDVFFDVRLNKRLSKQLRRRWCEPPLRSLWRHCNDFTRSYDTAFCAILKRPLLLSEIAKTLWSTWWPHQIETFSALLAICAGISPVPGEFPAQRPVTRRFDVYFDLRLS